MGKIKSKNIVAKANDLIMAKYDLSLAEQRLIIEVASMVHPKHDDDFLVYDVSVKDYVNLISSTAKNEYQRMKELAESLLKKPLFIKNDDGGFTGLNWFSSLRYIPSEGVLRCRFDKALKPYLLKLNEFYTSYQLENILRLKSKYAVRIYEILKSQHDLKRKKSKSKKISWEVELEELRKMIAIPDSYTWQDIKRQILKESRNALEATNIRFDFGPIKCGRRVHAVQFTITDTGQLALDLEPADQPQPEASGTESGGAASLGLLELIPEEYRASCRQLIQEALQAHSPEYIRDKISQANAENPSKYPGWLRRAIEENYQDVAALKKVAAAKKRAATVARKKAAAAAEKKAAAEKEKNWKIAEEIFAALPENEQKKLLDEAEEASAEGIKFLKGLPGAAKRIPEIIQAQAVEILMEKVQSNKFEISHS